MTPRRLASTAVLGAAVPAATLVVMIARATLVLSPSDRGQLAACHTDVSSVQAAVNAYRNTPLPDGSATADGQPGPSPSVRQLVNHGYLHTIPNSCRSYNIDGNTGLVSAVATDGTAVQS